MNLKITFQHCEIVLAICYRTSTTYRSNAKWNCNYAAIKFDFPEQLENLTLSRAKLKLRIWLLAVQPGVKCHLWLFSLRLLFYLIGLHANLHHQFASQRCCCAQNKRRQAALIASRLRTHALISHISTMQARLRNLIHASREQNLRAL
jgi:hypothetical protein